MQVHNQVRRAWVPVPHAALIAVGSRDRASAELLKLLLLRYLVLPSVQVHNQVPGARVPVPHAALVAVGVGGQGVCRAARRTRRAGRRGGAARLCRHCHFVRLEKCIGVTKISRTIDHLSSILFFLFYFSIEII